MAKLPLHTWQGPSSAQVEVADWLVSGPVNQALLYAAVTTYRTNLRHGLAETKTRGKVRGGGKKPWKQKHTGRARAGTIRSPLWRHGGIIFGPHRRPFDPELPQQMRRQALLASLRAKQRDGELVVIDRAVAAGGKTKAVAHLPAAFALKHRSLVVVDAPDPSLSRALHNHPLLELKRADDVNAFDVLNHEKVLISQGALARLSQRLQGVAHA